MMYRRMPKAKLELDPASVWATFRGDNTTLSLIEKDLQEGLQAAGRRLAAGVKPWIRTDTEVLKVLSGLISLVWPDYPVRSLWHGTVGELCDKLQDLEQWGWRTYQVGAVRDAVLAPLGRGLVEVGTGGGKTRIAWGIAYVCGGTWRYVVHGTDLVSQAAVAFRTLNSLHPEVDLSAYSWFSLPSDGTGVIVDECHQAAARGRAARLAAGSWAWRVGLSGTPLDRADELNTLVVGLFGRRVAKVGVRELTDKKYLAPGVVKVVKDLL